MTPNPPRFRTAPPKPCDACPVVTWGLIHDPATQEGERAIRRHERQILAGMVKTAMTSDELQQLARSHRPMLARLAQTLLAAIAERENEDAA